MLHTTVICRRARLGRLAVALSCAVGGLVIVQTTAADEWSEFEFFESRIRPVLVKHCYECHSAAAVEVKGGLRLDSREGIRRGGEAGPGVVPGKPDDSLLIDAMRHGAFKMPPDKKLPDAIIADFVRWVERGAVDPRDKPPTADEAAEMSWQAVFDERRAWWSLQPLKDAAPPKIADAEWSQSAVDRFIKAKLEEAKIEPTPEATEEVLRRRLSYVLTGLPPKAEVLNEKSFEAAVDMLLASPHFGERFARHWMDVVRYGDTYGYEWDVPAKGAWRYRDYLIRAFNQDVGFDQLVREQIAGDLLEKPRTDAAAGLNESLIGTMFYHLGEHRHGDSLQFNGIHQEMINNKIDAFSKAFLATTVACARCHDHKLDAVAQKDYYALASVFMTPRWTARCVDLPDRNGQELRELSELRDKVQAVVEDRWKSAAEQLAALVQQSLDKVDAAALKKAKPEDLDFPLLQIAACKSDAEVEAKWKELSAAWRKTHELRKRENTKFKVVFDPDRGRNGLVWEGQATEAGLVDDVTPRIALDGDAAVAELLPRGIFTHALSSKLPGAMHTRPLQTFGAKYVSMQLAGGEWAGNITIVENAFQSERLEYLEFPQPTWKQFGTFSDQPGWNVRLEVATADLNPNFPARWGKVKSGNVTLSQRDTGEGKRSWFGVTKIVTHDEPGTPADELTRFASLYSGDVSQSKKQAAKKIAVWLQEAVLRQCRGQNDSDDDAAILNFLLYRQWLPNSLKADTELRTLVNHYREIEAKIEPPRTVIGMAEQDTKPVAYKLNVRGNVDELGDAVPHDFLRVFAGRNNVAKSPGSGRRELAEFLVRGDHPLTARVYVNRVWSWIFGEGLVRTPDDFGHLGRAPTHPELLDYLAREFAADGWSTKRFIRRLLLSRTFRSSGNANDAARTADPENGLWHHYPTRRLEAEAVRDAMIAVSGRLDQQLFGPPIDPPRAKEDDMKRLFSGPVDGHGRRSIYLKMTIMEPPKFLAAFNQPSPKIPTGRRDASNVPIQALALLNDPLVAGQAEYWAKQLVQQPHKTVRDRLDEMFLRAFARTATKDEIELWTAALEDFASDGVDDHAALLKDTAAWTRAAHAMFNTKEFIYVR